MIFNDLHWLVMTFNYFVSKLCLDAYERGMFFSGGEKGGEATGKGGGHGHFFVLFTFQRILFQIKQKYSASIKTKQKHTFTI